MRRLFKTLLCRNFGPAPVRETRRDGSRRVAPTLEAMETRKMLTAGVSLTAGVISIAATDHGDTVAISRVNYHNPAYNTVNVDWTHDSTTSHLAFPAAGIKGVNFNGGGGNDWVTNGTNLPANLYGNGGNDTIIGGGAADRIDGADGNDFLAGGAGNDIITGGDGNNTLIGNDGDDILFAAHANYGDGFTAANTNSVYGGAGNDTIFGSTWGVNNLYGGAGNDMIVGKAHSTNFMYGEDGNDTLIGTGSFNLENGGKGVDVLEALTPNSYNILNGGDDNDPDFFFNQGIATSVWTYNVAHPGDVATQAFVALPPETYPYINQF